MRCGTPGNVRSASAIASSSMPGRARRRRRGRGVLAVVRAGDARLGRERVVGGELDAARRARERRRSRAARRRVVRASGCSKIRSLASRVRLERAVAVEVVGLEVEQDGDRGRSVSTSSSWNDESSQTIQASGGDLADERRQRAADVAGDLDRPSGRAEHRAEQLARRRLAVRARSRRGSGSARSRAPSSISLQTGMPRVARARDERRLARDARALHDELDPL